MMECSLDFSYSFSNASHVFSYDLCPLFSHHQSFRHEFSEETLPTRTNYVYEIALGRGIKKDGTLPAELQCPNDSLICMQAVNTRPNHPSEPPRIIQVVPVAISHTKPNFRIANTTTGTDTQEPHLQLTVRGLEYMGMKQKAVFHVFCDKTSLETSTPKLEHLYRWQGSHVFSWTSAYGCPAITARDTKDDPDAGFPDPGDKDETLPPANTHQDEDDLLAKPQSKTPVWPLSLSACILFIIAFRTIFLKRYKRYILQLMHRFPISSRYQRTSEHEFLLENISSQESTAHPPGYQKYTF